MRLSVGGSPAESAGIHPHGLLGEVVYLVVGQRSVVTNPVVDADRRSTLGGNLDGTLSCRVGLTAQTYHLVFLLWHAAVCILITCKRRASVDIVDGRAAAGAQIDGGNVRKVGKVPHVAIFVRPLPYTAYQPPVALVGSLRVISRLGDVERLAEGLVSLMPVVHGAGGAVVGLPQYAVADHCTAAAGRPVPRIRLCS